MKIKFFILLAIIITSSFKLNADSIKQLIEKDSYLSGKKDVKKRETIEEYKTKKKNLLKRNTLVLENNKNKNIIKDDLLILENKEKYPPERYEPIKKNEPSKVINLSDQSKVIFNTSSREKGFKKFKELLKLQKSGYDLKTDNYLKTLSRAQFSLEVDNFLSKINMVNSTKNKLSLETEDLKKVRILLESLNFKIDSILSGFNNQKDKVKIYNTFKINKENTNTSYYIDSIKKKKEAIDYAEKVMQAMGQF